MLWRVLNFHRNHFLRGRNLTLLDNALFHSRFMALGYCAYRRPWSDRTVDGMCIGDLLLLFDSIYALREFLRALEVPASALAALANVRDALLHRPTEGHTSQITEFMNGDFWALHAALEHLHRRRIRDILISQIIPRRTHPPSYARRWALPFIR